MGFVILLLIFIAVMYAMRYVARHPEVWVHGFTWILKQQQRRAQKEYERQNRCTREYSEQNPSSAYRSTQRHTRGKEPIIPREYAQDVEYEEVAVTERVVTPGHSRVENQVSDAEWEEIRK